jgi:hypothetical protein
MTEIGTHLTRDGYSHSWSNDNEDRWEAFRQLVIAGVHPDDAADRAGLPRA